MDQLRKIGKVIKEHPLETAGAAGSVAALLLLLSIKKKVSEAGPVVICMDACPEWGGFR